MITSEDFIKLGFKITEEKPLVTYLKHSRDERLKASCGKYGEIFIGEKHWCNDEYERTFYTINHKLTYEDLLTILSFLNITIPK